jgi:hypothetical protein
MESRKKIDIRTRGKSSAQFVYKQPDPEGKGTEYFWFKEAGSVDPDTFGKIKSTRGFFDTPEARRQPVASGSWSFILFIAFVVAIVGVAAAATILVSHSPRATNFDIIIAAANIIVTMLPLSWIIYLMRKASRDVQN